MRASQLVVVAAVAAAVAALAYAVIAAVRYDGVTLAFVMAAISGSYTAAILHHRAGGSARPAMAIKAQVGAVLAVTCAAVAVALMLLFHPFQFPEVQIPIAAVGSFVFPLVLMKYPEPPNKRPPTA